MQNFLSSPLAFLESFYKNWSLIRPLLIREILGRYRGSILGLLWSFFNPILMLLVYTFFFSIVFKARWSGAGDSKAEFAMVLFVGLIIFNLFSECIMRAPTIILTNVNYVKKVTFPLEILPIVNLGAACFHLLISLMVWLLFYLIFFGIPPVTIALFPLILLPLLMFILGVSWFLASLGVYLRDVSQVTGLVVTALMFISPIFFPLSALPEQYQKILILNPLAQEIEMMRGALILGNAPSWPNLFLFLVIGSLVAFLGFAWFQKTRKGFADVM
jgi:lipopolysaccharide transport system permease protein